MAGLVPAIPIQWGKVLYATGITGTRPVMTRREDFRQLKQKGPERSGPFA
jgi:hypothetical protein